MVERYIQIQWTCASLEEARTIANALVKRNLVACANLLPEVESIYLWKGEVETSKEVKVYFKTTQMHFDAVRDYILKHASYEVPEISQLLFQDGNPAYFEWISSTVKKQTPNLSSDYS